MATSELRDDERIVTVEDLRACLSCYTDKTKIYILGYRPHTGESCEGIGGIERLKSQGTGRYKAQEASQDGTGKLTIY